MKPSNGRAERRHHLARVKHARRRYWANSQKTPRQLGILSSTAALCSCYMCRNQRQDDGLTLQERRGIDSMQDQIDDLFYKENGDEKDC